MSKIITIMCDIKNCKNVAIFEQKNIQIIFVTEQTEGRSSKRYLDFKKIDICENCLNKILNGAHIIGCGAQGYNTYELLI